MQGGCGLQILVPGARVEAGQGGKVQGGATEEKVRGRYRDQRVKSQEARVKINGVSMRALCDKKFPEGWDGARSAPAWLLTLGQSHPLTSSTE